MAEASSILVPVERPDDDLLVLELRLDNQVLAEEMIGYLHEGGVLLSLREIVEALEFPITVDPAEGTASGWFIQENRRFALDLANREVTIGGKPGAFKAERVELHADDIYVHSALLDEWFPIRTHTNLSQLAILIEAREKLPLQLRRERQSRWKRLQRGDGAPASVFPEVEVPYRILGWPILDGTLTASYGPDSEGSEGETLRHEALVTGDLLGMTAELYSQSLRGGEEALEDPSPTRLKLGRKDPEARLLGPLRAREFEIGSLFTPERLFVSGSQPARGVVVSNFPVYQPEEFERTTLHGNALPGWEVELYQNESLIDFQVAGADGRYVFSGIPLLFGVNLFRIVLYGPQGQKREELRRVLIGDEMIRDGETRYRFAAGQIEEDLHLAPEEPERQGAETLYSLDLRRGFGRGLSAAVSVDSLSLRQERHTYLGLGLRRGEGGTFSRLDFVVDADGGWAGRVAIQSRWRSFGLLAQYDRFERFVSGSVPAARDRPRARALLRLDGNAQGGLFRPLSYSFAAEGGERESGAFGLRLSSRVTGHVRKLVLGHRLSLALDRQSDGERQEPELEGAFLTSGRRSWGAVRSEVGYQLEPDPRIKDLLLTGDWDLGRGRTLRLGTRRTVSPSPATRVSAGMIWNLRQALLGLSLNHDSGGSMANPLGGSLSRGRGFSADLSLAYSLRREPLSGRWHMSSRRTATEGAAVARVFLDQDQDGHFSAGDEPLAGVRFSTEGGGYLRGGTDERGVLLLSDLPLYRPVDVGIALGSLEDPAWVPQREGFGFTLRPGVTPAVEIPVVTSGEVEGTVYLQKGEKAVPVASVQLQLVDSQGRIRRESRSAYDGFYLFERVPPGRYTVRLDPEQLVRLGLRPIPEQTVEIGAQGEVIRGIDLHVERAATEEAVLGAPAGSR